MLYRVQVRLLSPETGFNPFFDVCFSVLCLVFVQMKWSERVQSLGHKVSFLFLSHMVHELHLSNGSDERCICKQLIHGCCSLLSLTEHNRNHEVHQLRFSKTTPSRCNIDNSLSQRHHICCLEMRGFGAAWKAAKFNAWLATVRWTEAWNTQI